MVQRKRCVGYLLRQGTRMKDNPTKQENKMKESTEGKCPCSDAQNQAAESHKQCWKVRLGQLQLQTSSRCLLLQGFVLDIWTMSNFLLRPRRSISSTSDLFSNISFPLVKGALYLCSPCTFFSSHPTSAEANYGVGKRELLVVILALEESRHWLEGIKAAVCGFQPWRGLCICAGECVETGPYPSTALSWVIPDTG